MHRKRTRKLLVEMEGSRSERQGGMNREPAEGMLCLHPGLMYGKVDGNQERKISSPMIPEPSNTPKIQRLFEMSQGNNLEGHTQEQERQGNHLRVPRNKKHTWEKREKYDRSFRHGPGRPKAQRGRGCHTSRRTETPLQHCEHVEKKVLGPALGIFCEMERRKTSQFVHRTKRSRVGQLSSNCRKD